ncbi:MAG: sodium:solute symporter family protein [Methanothrix sp.]|uniref:sodium:solute symporter family protein n=1 Tax=Methanothrix sp. TaxID=90426 RepID=UPI0025F4DC33|nr:sodium:solute symporter family protein [Methanothrix sp.]MCQ8903823.1 sodium:solute symporter family protein [Methanothrix sp.]
MRESYLVLIPMALYLLATAFLGCIVRSGRSWNEFFLAGRSLGTLQLTGSLVATIVGASSTIGLAGLGYSRGLPGAWWLLSGAVGLLILSKIAHLVRGTGARTLPEMIGIFYGSSAKKAASSLILIAWLGVIAAQIVAAGRIMGALFGHDWAWMSATAIVLIAYTAHGGQRAVVRTDLLQLCVMLAGLILMLAICLRSAPEALNSLQFPTSGQMSPQDVVSMVVVVGSMYLIGPDIYSRVLSARSPESAMVSLRLSAIIIIPLAFAITSIGIFARHLLPEIRPEDALILLMTDVIPHWAVGVIAAAFLAAVMSSADTSLLTASSILTLDLGLGSGVRARGLAALFVGSCSLLLAMSRPGIISTLMLSYTVFTGGFLVPVLAGFHRERLGLTPNSATAGILCGGITSLMLGGVYPLSGICASAFAMAIVSAVEKRRGCPDRQ